MSGGIDRRGGELGAAFTVCVIFNRHWCRCRERWSYRIYRKRILKFIVGFQVFRVVRIGFSVQ